MALSSDDEVFNLLPGGYSNLHSPWLTTETTVAFYVNFVPMSQCVKRCQESVTGCISFSCAAANFYMSSHVRKIRALDAAPLLSMCFYLPMFLCVKRCQESVTGCISFSCVAANFYLSSHVRKIRAFDAAPLSSMCFYVPMFLCVKNWLKTFDHIITICILSAENPLSMKRTLLLLTTYLVLLSYTP